jgi:hypothetical protein
VCRAVVVGGRGRSIDRAAAAFVFALLRLLLLLVLLVLLLVVGVPVVGDRSQVYRSSS